MKIRLVLITMLILFLPVLSFSVPTSITVDGGITDWVVIPDPTSNSDTFSMGELIWNDELNDYRTDNGNFYDIEQVRYSCDSSYLYFMIELSSMPSLGTNGDPWIQISFDINFASGSGNTFLALSCDTQVNTDAAWEYLLVIDLANASFASTTTLTGDAKEIWNGGNGIDILNTSWTDVSTVNDMVSVNQASHTIEVRIARSTIGNGNAYRTCITSGRSDGTGNSWDVSGSSDVMDCITNIAGNTWGEVSDGFIDYYDVIPVPVLKSFNDLLINEFMPDPVKVSDTNGEYFEIYNNQANPQDLNYSNGFWICDNGTNKTTLAQDLFNLPAYGLTVFGNDGNSGTNGGYTPDLTYTGFFLGNTSDSLILCQFKKEIDKVEYDENTWFGNNPGYSYERIAYASPSDSTNFAVALMFYGDGDYGTPGKRNSVNCDVTDVTAPDWPTPGISNITAAPSGIGGVLDIDWDQAFDNENSLVYYAVYRSTQTGFVPNSSSIIVTATVPIGFSDSGLTDGVTYYYRIGTGNCNGLITLNSDEVYGIPVSSGTDSIYSIQFNNTTPTGSDATHDICYPSPRDAEEVTVSAIVTASYTTGPGYTNFWIQDSSGAWNGVYVYGNNTNHPAQGDSISITATVDEYYGLTELKNISGYVLLGSGQTPLETLVTVPDVGGTCGATPEAYEGVLVTLQDVMVSQTMNGNGVWEVKDLSANTLKIDNTLAYSYTPALYDWIDSITGVMTFNFGEYRLEPRDDSDIVTGTAPCNTADATAPDWTVSGDANLIITDPETDGDLNLSWDSATDPENPIYLYYSVYRSTQTGFGPGVVNLIATGLTAGTYSDSGLTNGTTYYYRIRTYNCNNNERYNTDEGSGTPTKTVYPASSVVINEVVAKGTEWIELYNNTASPVDLSGWELAVYSTGSNGSINAGVTVGANSFIILGSSNVTNYQAL
ncbi:MAG: lamin tail domain-containing protein, partial [bacterium]|nr:lamin tail domain-containing protein [bacterium]